MRRFTLRFREPTLEAGYQRFDPDARLAAARGMIVFAASVGTCESLYRLFFEENGTLTIGRAAILSVFAVLVILYVASFQKRIVMASERALAIAMPLLAGGAIVHVAFAGEALSKVVFGVFFVFLVANVGIPYSHLIQHALGVTFLTTFLLLPKATLNSTEVEGTFVYLFFAVGVSSIVAYSNEKQRRRRFMLHLELEAEKGKSEALLLNTLPATIAARLKERGPNEVIVDRFDEAVVIFADIVEFTPMASALPAVELVRILNDLFSRLDVVCAQHGLEKIKTIGDAYMVVAGIPTPRADVIAIACDAALDILAAVERYNAISGSALQVRVGLHAGPVVAGIIGRHKFLYDLWGATVNIAARLESTSMAGRVHCTAAVAARLDGRFHVESRGMTKLKGAGEVETCFIAPLRVHSERSA